MVSTPTCPNCGEVRPLSPHPCGDPSADPMCAPCWAAAEEYGRMQVSEAWCGVRGCWNPPPDLDSEYCAEHVPQPTKMLENRR
jgi:hypothetical protein